MSEETQSESKGFLGKVDKFFGITEKGSTIRTEIIAGIVTFLTMAYILAVNPNNIIGDVSDPYWPSVFLATAIGSVVGTLLMSLLAKMPLAQAPGLGLNATIGGLIGGWGAFYCNFGNAMLLVLISGILFLLLSVITVKGISIRELIFDGIPASVRGAISVGIGLFIAFIGLQGAGLIVANPYTLVALVDLTQWKTVIDSKTGEVISEFAFMAPALVCLIGLFLIAVLEHFKVKGSVIIGIVAATIIGIPMGVTQWSGLSWKFWESFANFFSFSPEKGGTFFAAFTQGFQWDGEFPVMAFIMTIISFCMIDMFDTMGTVVGCTVPVGLADENGKPFNYNKIMISDSVATCAGAILGTSTVTTFVESGSGVAAGGRTGLTSFTTAVLFFLSIFLLPLFASIPSAATGAALIYVGCLMMKGIKSVNFEGAKNAVPAFLTIITMPLAYSITAGIGVGILSYVIIDAIGYLIAYIRYAVAKDKETVQKPEWDLSVVCIIVALLFVIYFFVPTSL